MKKILDLVKVQVITDLKPKWNLALDSFPEAYKTSFGIRSLMTGGRRASPLSDTSFSPLSDTSSLSGDSSPKSLISESPTSLVVKSLPEKTPAYTLLGYINTEFTKLIALDIPEHYKTLFTYLQSYIQETGKTFIDTSSEPLSYEHIKSDVLIHKPFFIFSFLETYLNYKYPTPQKGGVNYGSFEEQLTGIELNPGRKAAIIPFLKSSIEYDASCVKLNLPATISNPISFEERAPFLLIKPSIEKFSIQNVIARAGRDSYDIEAVDGSDNVKVFSSNSRVPPAETKFDVTSNYIVLAFGRIMDFSIFEKHLLATLVNQRSTDKKKSDTETFTDEIDIILENDLTSALIAKTILGDGSEIFNEFTKYLDDEFAIKEDAAAPDSSAAAVDTAVSKLVDIRQAITTVVSSMPGVVDATTPGVVDATTSDDTGLFEEEVITYSNELFKRGLSGGRKRMRRTKRIRNIIK